MNPRSMPVSRGSYQQWTRSQHTRQLVLRLGLAAAAIVVLDRAGSASAVATDGAGHVVTSARQRSVEIAKYDALSAAPMSGF